MIKSKHQEIWKDIPGYEGLYQVSNLGRVKSLGREVLLKPMHNKKGYLLVALYKNHIRKFKFIHRLVAQTFLSNPNNLPQVNHKDENKENNCVNNLEFCDNKYNELYGTRRERVSKNLEHRRITPVNQYDLDGNFIKSWKTAKDAAKTMNIPPYSICECCKGLRNQTRNFMWRYNKEVVLCQNISNQNIN